MAEELTGQAQSMSDAIRFFRLRDGAEAPSAKGRAAATAARPSSPRPPRGPKTEAGAAPAGGASPGPAALPEPAAKGARAPASRSIAPRDAKDEDFEEF